MFIFTFIRIFIPTHTQCYFSGERLSAAECLEHPWMNMTYVDTLKNLETAFLRKYLARRRWRRWFNAIKAMNRMTRNGMFNKNKSGVVVITEDMLGDYGDLGFFV